MRRRHTIIATAAMTAALLGSQILTPLVKAENTPDVMALQNINDALSPANIIYNEPGKISLNSALYTSADVPTITRELTDGITETIHISSYDELKDVIDKCHYDTWSKTRKFILDKDIEIPTGSFEAIATFGGLFDGNGHTISNTGTRDPISINGLFRTIQRGGIVQNLNVKGEYKPDTLQSRIGGIVGVNRGCIINCTFTGNIDSDSECGGIAGYNAPTGIIQGCEANGTIIATTYTGGIAGYNEGTITNCQNHAEVNTTYKDEPASVERLTNTVNNILLYGKVNTAENTTARTDCGGIAGFSSGTIVTCSNDSAIGYEHVGYNTGGIAGLSEGFVSDCTNSGIIQGRKDVGGIAGQLQPYMDVVFEEGALGQIDSELTAVNTLIDHLLADADSYNEDTRLKLRFLSAYTTNCHNNVKIIYDELDEDLYNLSGVTGSTMRSLCTVTSDLDAYLRTITADADTLQDCVTTYLVHCQLTYPEMIKLKEYADQVKKGLDTSSESAKKLAEIMTNAAREIKNDAESSGDELSGSIKDSTGDDIPENSMLLAGNEHERIYLTPDGGIVVDSEVNLMSSIDSDSIPVQPSSPYDSGDDGSGNTESGNGNNATQEGNNPSQPSSDNSSGNEGYENPSTGTNEGGGSTPSQNTSSNNNTTSGNIDNSTGGGNNSAYNSRNSFEDQNNTTSNINDATVNSYNNQEESGKSDETKDTNGSEESKDTEESDNSKEDEKSGETKEDEESGEVEESVEDDEASLSGNRSAGQRSANRNAGLLGDTPEDPSLSDLIQQLNDAVEAIGDVKDVWNYVDPKAFSDTLSEFMSGMSSINTAVSGISEIVLTHVLGISAGFGYSGIKEALHQLGTDMKSIPDTATRLQGIFNSWADLSDSLHQSAQTMHNAGDGVYSSFSSMQSEFDSICESTFDELGRANADLDAINVHMGNVRQIISDAVNNTQTELENRTIQIDDISEAEIESSRTARITVCQNLGVVEGDNNSGGIIGLSGLEYDFDPEKDIVQIGGISLDYELRTMGIVDHCTNNAGISCKNNYSGGIAGHMEVGTIDSCEDYGNVSGGDYVGGIIGYSKSSVQESYAKCYLSGGEYIGGIAGYGYKIKDCETIVRVTDSQQYVGAIAGQISSEETTSISGNTYYAQNIYGIDGVSYDGIAEGVTYQEIESSADTPITFKNLIVTFVAEDTIISTISVPYGGSIAADKIPDVPQKEGFYGRWDITDYTNIAEDTTVTARYGRVGTLISAEQVRNGGVKLLLAEGLFQEHDKIDLTLIPEIESETGFPAEIIMSGNIIAPRTYKLSEKWKAVIPDDGSSSHTFRFLPQAYAKYPDDILIYIQTGDGVTRLTTGTYGKYITFAADGSDVVFAVYHHSSTDYLRIIIGAVLLAGVALAIFFFRKKRMSAISDQP